MDDIGLKEVGSGQGKGQGNAYTTSCQSAHRVHTTPHHSPGGSQVPCDAASPPQSSPLNNVEAQSIQRMWRARAHTHTRLHTRLHTCVLVRTRTDIHARAHTHTVTHTLSHSHITLTHTRNLSLLQHPHLLLPHSSPVQPPEESVGLDLIQVLRTCTHAVCTMNL